MLLLQVHHPIQLLIFSIVNFVYFLFVNLIDFTLEYLEKSENERVLTPELEQVLIQIAKTGYSR